MSENRPLAQDFDNAHSEHDRNVFEDESVANEPKGTLNTARLFLLTLGTFGLQIGWSIQLAEVTPFLLSLGLSKAVLAIVWIAGPLTGTLVQPYVGKWSDNYNSKWGRRRPFCIAGAIGSGLTLIVLSRVKTISEWFFGIFGSSGNSPEVRITAQIIAIFLVYLLDFFVNLLQAALRAFVVDCSPQHQQDTANAWIARMMNAGNIIGYLTGYADTTRIFPFLGDSQFKVLCVLALFTMLITVGISCGCVTEPSVPARRLAPTSGGLVAIFKSVIASMRGLSPHLRGICIVQVCAWVGWFPYLFYATTYVGEMYADSIFRANPDMPDDEIDAVYERGTRAGTFALLIAAIVSFATSVIVPMLIAPSDDTNLSRSTSRDSSRNSLQQTLASLERFRIPSLDLTLTWLLSHLLFSLLMFLTFFVNSVTGATCIIAAVGVAWAIIHWVPFALVSQEASRRDAERRALRRRRSRRRRNPDTLETQNNSDFEDSEDDDDDEPQPGRSEDSQQDEAGVLLGILNVSIAAPQILASLIASAIFKAFQKPRGAAGDTSVAWVFRFSGLCGLAAAWFTKRLREGAKDGRTARTTMSRRR